MARIHEELLKMVGEIDQICRKYGITYYLAGGTALGAVRHNGFIPWDDDVDLFMPRDQFYKFREAVKKEAPAERVLECIEDNPDYPGIIPRYTDTNTTFISRYNIPQTCAAGALIDVFILDPIPRDKEAQRRQWNLLNIYSEIVVPHNAYTHRDDDDFLMQYRTYMERYEKGEKEALLKELSEELFTCKEEDADQYMLRWASVPFIFDKDLFGEPVRFPFEGLSLPVPQKWDEYLTVEYGTDWMYFPHDPAELGHTMVLDLEHPYPLYYEDAEPYLGWADEMVKGMVARKELLCEAEIRQRPFRELEADVKAGMLARAARSLNESAEGNIARLTEEGNWQGILHQYAAIITAQFSHDFIGAPRHSKLRRVHNPVLIPLDGEILTGLIRAMLATGQYGKVARWINLLERKNSGELLPDDLKKLTGDILALRRCMVYGDVQGAKEAAAVLPAEIRAGMPGVQKMVFWSRLADADDTLAQEIEAAFEKTGDIELRKYLGDLKFASGDLDTARADYEAVLTTSNNGLMIQDIQQKMPGITGHQEEQTINRASRPGSIEGQWHFSLLQEFDKFCKTWGLRYFLAQDTALGAFRAGRFINENLSPTVMMPPQDAAALVRIAGEQLPPNRELLYPGNDPMHYGHTIYYGAADTSDIRMAHRAFDPIHLTILVLKRRGGSSLHRKWTHGLEVADFVQSKATVNQGRKTAAVVAASHVISGIGGGRKFRRRLWERQIKDAAKGTGQYFLPDATPRQRPSQKLEESRFDSNETLQLYGQPFPVVSEPVRYMRNAYGVEDASQALPMEREQEAEHVLGTHIGYEVLRNQYYDTLYKSKAWASYEAGRTLRKAATDKMKRNELALTIMRRSQARFRLTEQYRPRIPQLQALEEAGNYEELWEELKDYDAAVRTFRRWKLGIWFDETVAEIYLRTLERRGEKDFAASIRQSAEKEGLKPVTVL